MLTKPLLIIFIRNAEWGKVKTRLAKSIGNDNALDLYNFLLKHTAEISTPLPIDKWVFYSEEIIQEDVWPCDQFIKKKQKGESLGLRMKNAFIEGKSAGYNNIIIIGSDLFDITTEELSQAFATLNNSDVVIGPAIDGGYYLLGLKEIPKGIFDNKEWGTSSIFKDTLVHLKTFKTSILPPKNDIDTIEDILNNPVFIKYYS